VNTTSSKATGEWQTDGIFIDFDVFEDFTRIALRFRKPSGEPLSFMFRLAGRNLMATSYTSPEYVLREAVKKIQHDVLNKVRKENIVDAVHTAMGEGFRQDPWLLQRLEAMELRKLDAQRAERGYKHLMGIDFGTPLGLGGLKLNSASQEMAMQQAMQQVMQQKSPLSALLATSSASTSMVISDLKRDDTLVGPGMLSGKYLPAEVSRIENEVRVAYEKVWYLKPASIIWIKSPQQLTYLRKSKMYQVSELPVFSLSNLHSVYVYETNKILLVKRPFYIKKDSRNRLHCDDGPAIKFEDGFSYYYLHNVPVEKHIVMSPWKITAEEIQLTRNAEIKRVMIEKFASHWGYGKFLKDIGAHKRHEDRYGILWEVWDSNSWRDEPAYCMVEVVNSTPEPDGSFNRYYLKVPPGIRTAKEAVAWTFEMDADEYAPEVET